MWPNLIPGDILQATEIPAQFLKPGMIAVFTNSANKNLIVHRVVKVRNLSTAIVVTSAGDRSGVDVGVSSFSSAEVVKTVTGVLRKGKYRKITAFMIPVSISPYILIRVHCTLVRKLMW